MPPRRNALSTTPTECGGKGREVAVRCRLVLYVAGASGKSLIAIAHVRALCNEYFGAVHLEIVDIDCEPEAASHCDILVAPTLIKRYPPPLSRFVGDMSDKEKVARDLGLW